MGEDDVVVTATVIVCGDEGRWDGLGDEGHSRAGEFDGFGRFLNFVNRIKVQR